MFKRNLLFAVALVVAAGSSAIAADGPVKYARFCASGATYYGVVDGDNLLVIEGDLFGDHKTTDKTFKLADVKLLVPTVPTQVLAMAGNYKSHLNQAEIPPAFRIPQPFHKGPSCLIATGEPIVLPKDSGPVHYEAELVIVIGRRAKDVTKEQAKDYIFGVTCGNDVSERYWQNDPTNKDVQWWRAKGADTFGPCGPFITRGLDYDNLQLDLRLNGEVRQKERTNLFIHDVPTMVSYISQYVTLNPGDLIFTGTPGKTDLIKAGDVVEVELEGVGVLSNPVEKE